MLSLISKRLEAHLIANSSFINTSIQKGCMEKVPGCWEHMSTVWSALKEARSNKSDLATIWLDIANAYGSIPHKLIFFALKRYGVHDHWISLVQNYYVGIYSKLFSESAPSNWHQHQRGIFAGCTLSIILFLAGMNIILEYVLVACAPHFITSSKISLPLVKAFMSYALGLSKLRTSFPRGSKIILSKTLNNLNLVEMPKTRNKNSPIVFYNSSCNPIWWPISRHMTNADMYF